MENVRIPASLSGLRSGKSAWTGLALGFFLFLQGLLLLFWGGQTDFMTYRQDIGETLVAYRQSENLRGTFSKYGMLHVETLPSGRAKVYTHNVNLGTYYFFFWRTLGIENRSLLTLTVLPIYLLSLLVAFLTVRRITESLAIAWVFLGLMTLDFANVGAFAFNALRAWHYLGLFGVLYGVHEIVSRPPATKPILGLVVTALSAMISFGCGYDFFVIAGACAGTYVVLASTWRRMAGAIFWLVICFFVPFFLRQLEVIYWMGLPAWSMDFYTTFAIKVPFASRVIHIPSVAEIDALYDQAGLLRPPAYPTSDLMGIWNTAEPLARLALFPSYGFLSCMLVVALGLAGLTCSLFFRKTELFRVSRLPAAYLFGASIGLFVFAPFSLHVYLKHNFPLVAGLVHLAVAVCIVLLLNLARKYLANGKRVAALLFFAGGSLFITNAVAVQIRNTYESKELDFRWVGSLAKLRGDQSGKSNSIVAAVMFPPESAAILENKVSVQTVAPDKAPWILARKAHRLVEHPLIDLPAGSEAVTTLLYAPGDGWCNLDAREPDLHHRDWLVSLWQGLRNASSSQDRIAKVKPYVIAGPAGEIRPDDIVHLKFAFPVPTDLPTPRAVPQLEVRTENGDSFIFQNIIDDIGHPGLTGAVSLVYNAKFNTLDVYARLPHEVFKTLKPAATLDFRGMIYFGGILIRSEPVTVKFSSTIVHTQIIPILTEPTTGQLCSAFRQYKVIERSRTGVGYAIFDLHTSSAP
jgi:hypothetical protein